jgi:hypothetical protein
LGKVTISIEKNRYKQIKFTKKILVHEKKKMGKKEGIFVYLSSPYPPKKRNKYQKKGTFFVILFDFFLLQFKKKKKNIFGKNL